MTEDQGKPAESGSVPAVDIKKEHESVDKAKSSDSGSKNRKVTATLHQGYDYKGEKEEIGLILALRTKRFNNKVVYTSFVEELQNYVLSNFNDAVDVIPIIEELRDTTEEVRNDVPMTLKGDDKNNLVQQWIKQEQVKRYFRRIENLRNNKETLYGLVWGQCSSGLQEAIKSELEYDTQSKLFNTTWLLEKAKLISSGVDERANKYLTLLRALTSMVNVRQGQNKSNDSFRKRVDSVTLTVSLVAGSKMLYSEDISNAVDPTDPSDEEVEIEEQRLKAMLMIIRSDFGRFGDLQESLLEGMHKGRDEFPTTVVQAYDLLQRVSNDIYQNMPTNQPKQNKCFTFCRNKQAGGLSFMQKGKTCELVPGRDGKNMKTSNATTVRNGDTTPTSALIRKKLHLHNLFWHRISWS